MPSFKSLIQGQGVLMCLVYFCGVISYHLYITITEIKTTELEPTGQGNSQRLGSTGNQVPMYKNIQPSAACTTRRPTRSYSQAREDMGLYDKFFSKPNLCNGTFLELGALDGVLFSNTLMYEKDLDWRGILIEASPRNFKGLQNNRPLNSLHNYAVCKPGQKKAVFYDEAHRAVGALPEEMPEWFRKRWHPKPKAINVTCTTITDVIKESQMKITHFDFISIDVEGAELRVLEGYDWSIPVRLCLIEMDDKSDQVRALLTSRGFRSTLPDWNIRDACPDPAKCTHNEVFVNLNWPHL